MTYLELINKVLIMLREDSVSTYNENDYSLLVSEFINKAKYLVEDAWTWHRLRETIRVTTAANTYNYVLTGAGERFILLDRKEDAPDVLNDTDDVWMEKAPYASWMTLMLNRNDTQLGTPYWFDFNGYDSSGDPIVDMYPIPDGAYAINFQLYIPQEELSSDATKIIVPWRPVVELAYLFALEERGEDAGTISDRIEQWQREMLSNAIAKDVAKSDDEMIWRVE